MTSVLGYCILASIILHTIVFTVFLMATGRNMYPQTEAIMVALVTSEAQNPQPYTRPIPESRTEKGIKTRVVPDARPQTVPFQSERSGELPQNKMQPPSAIKNLNVNTGTVISGAEETMVKIPKKPGSSVLNSTSGQPRNVAVYEHPAAEQQRHELSKEHYEYIRTMVTGKTLYPPMARRMGWEGKTVVSFTIIHDGSIKNVRVTRGSGHGVLDQAALNAVKSASPFSLPPVQADITIPVQFTLYP